MLVKQFSGLKHCFGVWYDVNMLSVTVSTRNANATKYTLTYLYVNACRLIAELSPGKKGGDYELPFGGRIHIPAGILGKKDVITCCMMSPSDRYKYMPPLKLVSTLYLTVHYVNYTMCVQ